jgi:hypothetical protein
VLYQLVDRELLGFTNIGANATATSLNKMTFHRCRRRDGCICERQPGGKVLLREKLGD